MWASLLRKKQNWGGGGRERVPSPLTQSYGTGGINNYFGFRVELQSVLGLTDYSFLYLSNIVVIGLRP